MYLQNQSSSYQPLESVGSLSMVSLSQVRDEENLDYLQNLCGFVDQMNLNPLWFQSEGAANKLKVLEIYQTAINYSKNLSAAYEKQLDHLKKATTKMRQENEEKEKRIRDHKQKVERLKDEYKGRKKRLYKAIYMNLKQKIKEEEERENYRRDRSEGNSVQEPPQIVYYHQLPPGYYPNQRPYPEYREPYQAPSPQPQLHPHPQFQPGDLPPGNPQEVLAQKFRIFFDKEQGQRQAKVSQQNSKGPERRPSAVERKDSTKELNIKKTDQSILKKQGLSSEEESEIMHKLTIGPNVTKKTENEIKGSVGKRRASIERSNHDDDFPNLIEQSRKSINSKEHGGNSTNSLQQNEFDSINKITLNNKVESRINSQKPFQSKIQKKAEQVKPKEEPEQIMQLSDELGLSLPGESTLQKKKSSKQEQLKFSQIKQDKNKLVVAEEQFSIKKSKFSSDDLQPQIKMYPEPPQRGNNKNKSQLKEEAEKKDDSRDSFGDIALQPDSNVRAKGSNQKEKQFDFGDIKDSRQITKLSGVPKKAGKGESGNEKMPAQLYPDIPVRKSLLSKSKESQIKNISNSSTSVVQNVQNEVNEDKSKAQARQSQEFGAGALLRSNVGLKNGSQNSLQPKKMFPEQPVKNSRPSEVNPLQSTGSHQVDVKAAPIIKENQYQADFQDEDFDPNTLLVSRLPIEKKESKNSQPEVRDEIKKPTVKAETSRVEIAVSSAMEISQKAKYWKLKNEEFKPIAQQEQKIEKRSRVEDSEDPFDFIDSMPGVSVFGKKPSAKPKQREVSIKNLPENVLSSESQNKISINLITPDNENQKILAKKDYEKRPPSIKDNLKVEQSQKQEDLQNSLLPKVEKGMLRSVPSDKKQTNLLQINNKNVLTSKKQEEEAEVQEEINLQQVLRDENVPASNYKKEKLLMMARQIDKADPSTFKETAFANKKIDQTIKKVCNCDVGSLNSLQAIEKAKRQMEVQIKRMRGDQQKRRRMLENAIKEIKTPPKMLENDSLLYSTSQFQQPSQKNSAVSKKQEERASIPGKQLTNSFEIKEEQQIKIKNPSPLISDIEKSPYTPDALQQSNMEIKPKKEEPQKGAQKYVLQNSKKQGSRQQAELLKKVGEGIYKYDKDDILNSELINLIKKPEESFDDEFTEQFD